MAALFPAIVPSTDLTVTMPRHPYVAKRSSGGGESRIKLSNVRVGAKLSLRFSNIDTKDVQSFLSHWRNARGTARDFQITAASLGAMAAPARALLLSTTWKYASPPTCTDICAGVPDRLLHTLEVELISQPRRVAAYINPTAPELSLPVMPSSIRGGIVTARAAIVGGLINTTGGISLPGAVLTTGQAWVVGGKFSTLLSEIPGVDISATAQVNGATPTASASTPAVVLAGASVAGGVFTLTGNMPGGALTATASTSGGVLTIPARNISGAAITATAMLAPGHYGQVAPGGALSAGATIVGGQFSTDQNGAAISASASVAGGQFSTVQNGGVLSASAVVVGGSIGESDPYFSDVVLLLHMNGSNGSTTFTDNSSSLKTPTVVGNTQISTAQSKFGGASAYFDGTGDYLRFPVQTALQFPGDFTIEAWIRPDILEDRSVMSSSSDSNVQIFRMDSNGNMSVYVNNGTILSVTAGIQANVWQHVALARSGSNTRLFVNGVQKGSTNTAWTATFRADVIGQHFFNGNPYFNPGQFKGFLDELRITKGCRYAANFTPQTGPFPDS